MRIQKIAHRRWLAGPLVMLASGLGCSRSPITSARIESALTSTFVNLVSVQVSWLGLPPVGASDVAAKATCRRLAGGIESGSGEWICALSWQGPDRAPMRDSYELFVTTDGCYTANVTTETLGGPRLKSRDGRDVRNLLYAFEGCFDTM